MRMRCLKPGTVRNLIRIRYLKCRMVRSKLHTHGLRLLERLNAAPAA